MGEVVAAFLRPEAVQQSPDPSPGRLNGAFGRVAEQGFELGEDLFNRVEVGGSRAAGSAAWPPPAQWRHARRDSYGCSDCP